jgi:hypothetical protein
VAPFNVRGQIQENREVGVSAADQNKMLSHGSPAPGTNYLARNSSKEEKIETRFFGINDDALVKSPDVRFSVIPAKAGIQSFEIVMNCLDSGFHRSDD